MKVWYENKTVENIEYDLAVIRGLKDENNKLKEAITEVINLLDSGGSPNIDWVKKRLSECLKGVENKTP